MDPAIGVSNESRGLGGIETPLRESVLVGFAGFMKKQPFYIASVELRGKPHKKDVGLAGVNRVEIAPFREPPLRKPESPPTRTRPLS